MACVWGVCRAQLPRQGTDHRGGLRGVAAAEEAEDLRRAKLILSEIKMDRRFVQSTMRSEVVHLKHFSQPSPGSGVGGQPRDSFLRTVRRGQGGVDEEVSGQAGGLLFSSWDKRN